jgi:EpsI family protein
LLAGQVLLWHFLNVTEIPLTAPELETLPSHLGQWGVTDEQVLEQGVVEYLRPDRYLIRDYRMVNRAAAANLFIAYFKSTESGYGPHSPRVCLPGSGWLVQDSRSLNLAVPGRPDGIPVNQYYMEKSGQHILVLYWYQNTRRIWSNEGTSRLYLAPDLLRYHRSDASLVRVTLPLGEDWPREKAFQYSADFVRQLFPQLVECLTKAG